MARKTARERQATAVTQPAQSLCIEFILDETSSMHKIAYQTVNGFNDFLKEQRQITGECRMSLTKFSSMNARVPYEDVPLNLVPDMTSSTFRPSGDTNLYDAIGYRTEQLTHRLNNWSIRPRVLFVVMTDGQDNCSSRYCPTDVRQIIEQNPDWTFVYLGADQDAIKIGTSIGFHHGNCKSFAGAEMHRTMTELSHATTVFRSTSAATKSFF